MNAKRAWYPGGVLVVGLSMLVVSCGGVIEPAAPAPPAATISPPAVPHSLEGRANCLVCHETGAGGAPRFPASHAGRPSDVCLACHVPPPGTIGRGVETVTPKPPAATAPTTTSAGELFGKSCAACHGVNRQGVPGFAPALTPESLATLSDAETRDAIADGLPGTAMPAFKGTLSPEEIDALVQLVKHVSP